MCFHGSTNAGRKFGNDDAKQSTAVKKAPPASSLSAAFSMTLGQAMSALANGQKVNNSLYPNTIYKLDKNGNLVRCKVGGVKYTPATLNKEETQAKYRLYVKGAKSSAPSGNTDAPHGVGVNREEFVQAWDALVAGKKFGQKKFKKSANSTIFRVIADAIYG